MIEVFTKISEATKLLMETGFQPAHVNALLAELGPALGVDRLYIFENQPYPVRGRLFTDARYEWTAPGVASLLESPTLRRISVRELSPLWEESLLAGRPVSCQTSAAPLRAKLLLSAHETQSLLLAPIQQGKERWGFVGMDDCRRPRAWTAEETVLLKALAGGLGTALRHKHMRASLSQARSRLAEMVLMGGTR